MSSRVNNRKMNEKKQESRNRKLGWRESEWKNKKDDEQDVRLRSMMMDVEAASVRLELTASQVRLDMRSFLLRRVMTSSFRTIPWGVRLQDSSIDTPSLSQRKKGVGFPVGNKGENRQTDTDKQKKEKVRTTQTWELAKNLFPSYNHLLSTNSSIFSFSKSYER